MNFSEKMSFYLDGKMEVDAKLSFRLVRTRKISVLRDTTNEGKRRYVWKSQKLTLRNRGKLLLHQQTILAIYSRLRRYSLSLPH